MIRKSILGALFAAATLFATGAYGENPHPATPAAAPAKGADKGDKKADKAADGDKSKSVEERAARKLKEHDAQREMLKAVLKAPMDDATKQELRRHAERIADLERIKTVAEQEKDTASVDKVTSLIAKENDRSDKWITKHVSTTTAATPPGTPAAVPVTGATDNKAGVK